MGHHVAHPAPIAPVAPVVAPVAPVECLQRSDPVLIRYFHEIPDARLAIFAFYALLVASVAALIVTLLTQQWYLLLVPLTGFLIAAGYAYRASMIANPRLFAFAAMQMLLIVPPLLLAAANYTCLGKALLMNGNSKKSLVRWLPAFFIVFDVVCLFIQIFGVTYLTKADPTKISTGLNLILAGLALALVVNAVFVGALLYTHKFTNASSDIWIYLYVTTACLLVRNTYRFVEFIQSKSAKGTGNAGYLASHELYLYLFDFAMIFVCLIVFLVRPPRPGGLASLRTRT